ncbi:MAG: dihydrofolate reductase [Verrucomicrobiaceae bacterium]|nr:dihydrofolate reductase [Verrucomicrobiaceae bacterium]
MTLSLIAAVSDDGFISTGKGVPWDLPDDRAHFRQYTAGGFLLVGRTTYQEMIGWFTDHRPIILSRDHAFRPEPGHHRVPTVPLALLYAQQEKAQELIVCGGAQTYAAAMPLANKLIVTRVHDRLGEGIAFPPIDPQRWIETSRIEHPADSCHAHAMTFLTYQSQPQRRRRA